MSDVSFSTEPFVTVAYSKLKTLFRTLSSIYYGEFYSEPCVTLAYLEPWHIQNIIHHNNSAEIKAYSEPCRISKIEYFIKNPE